MQGMEKETAPLKGESCKVLLQREMDVEKGEILVALFTDNFPKLGISPSLYHAPLIMKV